MCRFPGSLLFFPGPQRDPQSCDAPPTASTLRLCLVSFSVTSLFLPVCLPRVCRDLSGRLVFSKTQPWGLPKLHTVWVRWLSGVFFLYHVLLIGNLPLMLLSLSFSFPSPIPKRKENLYK